MEILGKKATESFLMIYRDMRSNEKEWEETKCLHLLTYSQVGCLSLLEASSRKAQSPDVSFTSGMIFFYSTHFRFYFLKITSK